MSLRAGPSGWNADGVRLCLLAGGSGAECWAAANLRPNAVLVGSIEQVA